jgi:hypothetical protein
MMLWLVKLSNKLIMTHKVNAEADGSMPQGLGHDYTLYVQGIRRLAVLAGINCLVLL